MKTFTIGELFTNAQLATLMQAITAARKAGTNVNQAVRAVLVPMMTAVDIKTGQHNDIRYIGYMLEAAYDALLAREAVVS
jgi:hypothetical protein